MKAVRIRRRKKGVAADTGVHWLRADGSTTVCGIALERLDVIDQVELERLPSTEGCFACERALHGYKRRSRSADQPVALQPSLGRVSREHGWSRILV